MRNSNLAFRHGNPAGISIRGLLLLLILLSPGTRTSAQRVPDARLHAQLLRGIDLSGRQRYAEALTAFDSCIEIAPRHPAGYLHKAILLEVMSLDFEVPVNDTEFLSLLEASEEHASEMLRRTPGAWEASYYLGMTYSYLAYYKFRDGKNWIGGFRSGLKAAGFLEECLEINPSAYDALTGIGTYKYWKSRRMSFLTWTPFVSDERALGIEQLRKAERYAVYTGSQAANSLVWIYIEEDRFTEAEETAKRILRTYPENRLFLWGLASAAEKQQKWRTARDAYFSIVRSIDGNVTERRYIELQARAKIASMSFRMGDLATARKECDWVLANSRFDTSGFTADGQERMEKRVREVREIRSQIP